MSTELNLSLIKSTAFLIDSGDDRSVLTTEIFFELEIVDKSLVKHIML